ncbi:MAG: hypothetical protein KDJ50_10380 [Alphaproteobacteria bacterium]|nr:hypothetical protein [Alphaproteobacteria bacterium]
MNFLDKLKSIFIDEFKMGAEMHSSKPIVYIDPDKLDVWRISREVEIIRSALIDAKFLTEGQRLPALSPEELERMEKDENLKAVVEKIRPHLQELENIMLEHYEQDYPGISHAVVKEHLLNTLFNSTGGGPFSSKRLVEDMCVINTPLEGELDPDEMYTGHGVFSLVDIGYSKEHIRPLPGTKELWEQFSGEHEGEHCNQPVNEKEPGIARDIVTLNGEIGSDLAALETLRKNGHHDVAQAVIDMRVLGAADGDYKHATSFFVDKDAQYHVATEEEYSAIVIFKNEMNDAVAEASGYSRKDAELLRKKDPQSYADFLERQIEAGNFPLKRAMTTIEIQDEFMKRMGVSYGDFLSMPVEKVPEMVKKYLEVEAQTGFVRIHPQSEFLEGMAKQYVGAVRRVFTEETKPVDGTVFSREKKNVPAEIKEDPDAKEAEWDAKLKDEAEFQRYEIMDKAVSKVLGITEQEASDLSINDQKKYIQAVKQALKNGEIDSHMSIRMSWDDQQKEIAKVFGKTVEQLDDIPTSIKDKISEYLEKRGVFSQTVYNPHLLPAIDGFIKDNEMTGDKEVGASAKTDHRTALMQNSTEITAERRQGADSSPSLHAKVDGANNRQPYQFYTSLT